MSDGIVNFPIWTIVKKKKSNKCTVRFLLLWLCYRQQARLYKWLLEMQSTFLFISLRICIIHIFFECIMKAFFAWNLKMKKKRFIELLWTAIQMTIIISNFTILLNVLGSSFYHFTDIYNLYSFQWLRRLSHCLNL